MLDADVTNKLIEVRGGCRRVMNGVDLLLQMPSEGRLRTDSRQWLDELEDAHTIIVSLRRWVMLKE